MVVPEGDVSTLWLTLNLARHLMKGYTVYMPQENSRRLIHDQPTNLFLLLASGPRAARLEGHQVVLEGNTNATFTGAAKLCDSQTLIESHHRGEHAPVYIYSVSNPSSLSIIYAFTRLAGEVASELTSLNVSWPADSVTCSNRM